MKSAKVEKWEPSEARQHESRMCGTRATLVLIGLQWTEVSDQRTEVGGQHSEVDGRSDYIDDEFPAD